MSPPDRRPTLAQAAPDAANRPPSTSPLDGPPSPVDEALLPIARRLAPAAQHHTFPLRWRQPGLDLRRLPMVGWFDPGQLIHTGFRALTSAIVGEQSDRRIVQALAARGAEVYDYSVVTDDAGRVTPRDELWIDYLADTGDGFNPTYACAYLLAQPVLSVCAPDASTHRLPRADVLVLGGDQVYPAPSREAYQQRLVEPFEAASAGMRGDPPADVFAVPGNHDWYDGLSAFLRLFCSEVGGRRFGGWRTRQTRSYFAIKLPGRWWLLGADSQLHGDLDVPQIEYFETIAERQMARGDRVVLCLSTPVWVHAHKYRQMGEVLDETDLIYLRERVFAPRGIELKVYLSGDLHHYRRHEEVDPADPGAPIQKITAGGGGAFLHPTHDEDTSLLEETVGDQVPGARVRRFGLRAAYPSVRRSWWLSFRNLAFGWINPGFGIVPALLYFTTAWLVASATGFQRPSGPLEALSLTASAFAIEPGLTLWVGAVLAAFVSFNKTRSVAYRWLGGLAHAAVHWVCVFHIGWGAIALVQWVMPGAGFVQFLAAGALVFAAGWAIGSIVMGLYLLVSLNVFGRHSEEAFSALRIQDFKNFLRIHVAGDGTLTIHPVGIGRVPRRWRAAEETSAAAPSALVPDGPLEMALIEPPIVVQPLASASLAP
jgi:3',5'-cyclic AMP phosphodiesterase CpdA